jgi:acetyl-CoA carboxylase, biotin carboxylase subunit
VRKLLVANRGEIAVRVIRACRELGIETVAVYSDCDRSALHVRLADEAWPLRGNLARDTYLRSDRLLEIARLSGADAVHPGYGFLAEHAGFAAACREAALAYVGPSPRAIEIMGSKTAARQAAAQAGVPLVPGTGAIPQETPDDAVAEHANAIGYPLLIKAVAGGGGKGMRLVASRAELEHALRGARSEAASAFGDSQVYLEKFVASPRHVEIQLLGDDQGTIVPFVERDCSIQRRHQKLVEESPSPVVTPSLRRELADAAVRVARRVGYTNAGTIEFLVAPDGAFYFLEMNTRLQVEHPVTEAVTGVDLVQWQIRIARGQPLTLDSDATLSPRGHAIELRVYAEDPDHEFLPSPGRVTHLKHPEGPGIRHDAALDGPGDVPMYYDALLSKLIAWGADRQQAVARLDNALRDFEIDGVRTSLPFFRWLVSQEEFLGGNVHTAWLDRVMAARSGRSFTEMDTETATLAAITVAIAAHVRATRDAQHGSGPRTSTGAWTLAARREGLR